MEKPKGEPTGAINVLPAEPTKPVEWSGYKNFVVGNYAKARFVLHIKAPDPYNQQSVEINIDGVAKKQRDVHLPADTWCRLAYNMPVNKTTLVRVHSQTYSGAVVIDEVWVIAK